MTEITVVRRGRVTYKAGYEQNRHEIGSAPVYKAARAEELSDGSVIYYPPTAATRTTDGGCSLPSDLLSAVVWERSIGPAAAEGRES